MCPLANAGVKTTPSSPPYRAEPGAVYVLSVDKEVSKDKTHSLGYFCCIYLSFDYCDFFIRSLSPTLLKSCERQVLNISLYHFMLLAGKYQGMLSNNNSIYYFYFLVVKISYFSF